jgi:16S rRNA (cytosine967-C5)-methyltransferase
MVNTDRRTAFLILREIETNGAYSNLATNKFLKGTDVYSVAFVRELVYGILRQQILLDFNINRLLRKPGSKLKPNERIFLRMGLYQLLFMDSVTDYAALNETVNLAGAFMKGQKGFVNGVLRSFVRMGKVVSLPDGADEVEFLSVKYSYSEWIVSLWLSDFGREQTEELLAAGNVIPPLTLRVNLNKTSRHDLIKKLKESGYEAKPGELCATSIQIKGTDVLSGELYKAGYFSVQDESSQIAIDILDPKPGNLLIDLCAAPGGKSCAAAEKMEDAGKIYSFDLHPKKKVLIEKEAKRLNLRIVSAKTADGTVFDSGMEKSADCVLVDAPCSGLGVVRRKPEIKLKPQDESPENISEKQSFLLSTACNYVKPGGKLMYSTCTINPAENEKITDEFLKKHTEFREVHRRQMLPSQEGTDGFFICLMRRQDD